MSMDEDSGMKTRLSTPSKKNACPTLPTEKLAPFCSVPLFVPATSSANPSPGQPRLSHRGPDSSPLHGPILQSRFNAQPSPPMPSVLYQTLSRSVREGVDHAGDLQ